MTTQAHTCSTINLPALLPARIHRIAEERLRSSSYPALRTISCQYHAGVLVLHGRLPTYYLKQLAQAAVDELDGVLEIANFIEVVRMPRSSAYSRPDCLSDQGVLAR